MHRGIGRALFIRGLSLLAVVVVVMTLMVLILGMTGLTDKMLLAIINEEVRSVRQSLAQTIKEPDELEKAVTAKREELFRSYGLDRPWYLRIGDTVSRIVTLDLGESRSLRSFSGSSKVVDIVSERLPNTVILVTTAVAFTAAGGLLLGMNMAYRAGSRLDRALSYLASVSNALPSWWVAIVLILALSYYFGLFPSGGVMSQPPPDDPLARALDVAWHATLPILTLVLISIGPWAYVTRTILLNISKEDYVTVARAKGLPDRLIMRRYLLRVAAPPILTSVILGLAGSIGGAILTETVFNWPGIGRLYYDAIVQADEAVIVALTFIFTVVYAVARFVLEVLYVLLDPRVRVS